MSKLKAIVCVDDEKIVLNTISKQISDAFPDYEVEIAESGEEALDLIEELEEDGYEIHLVVSDQIMPSMKGNEVLSEVHKRDKKVITVLLTGQAAVESTIDAINNANLFRYLTKPWDEQDLIMSIKKGLEQRVMSDKIEAQLVTFQKFIPKQFLQTLGIDPDDASTIKPGLSKKVDVSVLFLDIRNFTTISEQYPDDLFIPAFNKLLGMLEENIRTNEGFVDKYIGDAIMAIFPMEAHHAIKAGKEMLVSIETFNESQKETGIDWKMGVGIHSGPATMITVGSEDRIDSTLLGDTVNTAARLESLTKSYERSLLISGASFGTLDGSGQGDFEEVDEINVKGKSEPTKIYGLK